MRLNMNIKKIRVFVSFFLIISLSLIIASCQNNSKYSVIDEVNKYLTSEELQGRNEGSAGNIKAQNFLESKFKEIKLDYLNEQSYLIPYEHEIADFDNSVIELSINYKNTDEEKNLAYGIDFLPRNYLNSTNINCPITSDINDPEINDKALLVSNVEEMPQPDTELKAILIKTSLFKKSTEVLEKSSNSIPIIQVADKVFEELLSNNAEISYTINIKKKQITSNNVAGVIPGKDRSKALVISAHFDHLGTAGKIFFPGAYDNASGTAILIDLAGRLKIQSDKSPFPFDIVFCAFNSEESGLKGSKAFVNRLDEHNVINNINLDCLGMKNKGDMKILISHLTGGAELAEDFKRFAEDNGIKVEFSDMISDHESFDAKGFPAISIGQGKTDFMHTPEDTIEKLDVSKQQKFSNLLFNYIIKKYKTLKPLKHLKGNDEENHVSDTSFQKRIDDERENMWFNQHKIIEITNDKNEVVSMDVWGGKNRTEDIDDANNFLMSTNLELKAISQLDLYSFKKMKIIYTSRPVVNFMNQDTMVKDHIYTFEGLDMESIDYIEFEYQLKDNEMHSINLYISKENLLESVNNYTNVKLGENEYTIYYTGKGNILKAILKVQKNNKPYYIVFDKIYKDGDKINIDFADEKEVEHYIKLWLAGQEN